LLVNLAWCQVIYTFPWKLDRVECLEARGNMLSPLVVALFYTGFRDQRQLLLNI
jgi:hypothetical protein